MADKRTNADWRPINIALQGGGAHGAFTWGVLERLMGDRRIRFDGISGTSAGAMNAVIMANGFLHGKREGAIRAIRDFWGRIGEIGFHHNFGHNMWFNGRRGWNLDDTPTYMMFDMLTRMFSPYELNPLNINPLRDIIADMIDFEELRQHPEIKLFVTATNVRTCKPRVFGTTELTADVMMASACLPLLFKAVEIDGEHYWDGGYAGNPSIYPLIHECESDDVVIIQINPLTRQEVPTKARDILNRVLELGFNASLVREMRGLATINSLIAAGRLSSERYSAVHFHMIEASDTLPELGASSKFNTDPAFLRHLHALGVRTAEDWLAKNFDKLGKESSLDVFKTFV